MSALAYTRTGSGAPMVLLHGIGSWRHAWDPVLPALAERFDVIAVDLPGFGESDQLPAGAEASQAALAAAVAGLLDELGVTAPHIAGNSLGGWVALEIARIRQPASVTLLSPAGLWRGRIPLYCQASLWASRWLCKHAEACCTTCRPPARPYRRARSDTRPTGPHVPWEGQGDHPGDGLLPWLRRGDAGHSGRPVPGRAGDRRSGACCVRLKRSFAGARVEAPGPAARRCQASDRCRGADRPDGRIAPRP